MTKLDGDARAARSSACARYRQADQFVGVREIERCSPSTRDRMPGASSHGRLLSFVEKAHVAVERAGQKLEEKISRTSSTSRFPGPARGDPEDGSIRNIIADPGYRLEFSAIDVDERSSPSTARSSAR